MNNNNYSVLPFYNNIDEQNHRKSYAYGAIYPLFCKVNYLLPFQIIRAHRTTGITEAKIFDKEGNEYADITTEIQESGLQIVNYDENIDIFVYNGTLPMAINQDEGIYYLRLTDGTETWYSEMYTAVHNIEAYLRIEWWDDENLYFDDGIIAYEDMNFRNCLYLCTELGKPDYTFEEEGETRNGYFFPQKQISEKRYKCTITAPEFLCDVMRFIRMADHIRITDKYGREYKADAFLITPKWEVQGDLASVEIEFETNTVVKKIGRGYNRVIRGDFNDDYNDDFDNN